MMEVKVANLCRLLTVTTAFPRSSARDTRVVTRTTVLVNRRRPTLAKRPLCFLHRLTGICSGIDSVVKVDVLWFDVMRTLFSVYMSVEGIL
jgi:hypothetical protein